MGREGDESHDAGAFDGFANDALMFHAGAAFPAWKNLAGGGSETLQTADVFVIKLIDRVSTEVAGALFQWRVLWFRAHDG